MKRFKFICKVPAFVDVYIDANDLEEAERIFNDKARVGSFDIDDKDIDLDIYNIEIESTEEW